MTFPCQDELTFFEKLFHKQHRIFQTASDAGLPYSEVDMDEVRRNLLRMMEVFRQQPEFYEYETRMEGDEQVGMREVSFFVPFEFDRDRYRGVRLKIGRYWGFSAGVGRNGDYGYITIDIQDHSKS